MADRCPVTELDPTMCAHCRKLPDPFTDPAVRRPTDSTVGTPFTAQYRGKCACGTDFHTGDTIRADGAGGYLGPCCSDLTGDLP